MFIFLLYTIFYISLIKSQEVFVKDTGIGFIDENDIAIIFYLTLENSAEKDFSVSVFMNQCCDLLNPDEMDCTSMTLIGGDMGVLPGRCSKNITLIYPNLILMNRKGQCTVTIRYKHDGLMRQRLARIEYNTVESNEAPCPCISYDLDPQQNCKPVDCVVKYSGMKNYFDANNMQCIPVTTCVSPPELCVPEIGYSMTTNNCTNLNTTIGRDDLHVLDSNKSEVNDCVNCPMGNVVCHHGSTDVDGLCECDTGWTTTTDDEIYSPNFLLYHMCNVEVGAWNCINTGKIKTTTILIAVFAITIASKILILMCILNWCYKRYKEKKIQVCGDDLDIDRVQKICEEDSLDQCVCYNTKDKPPMLQTQTVNVCYYPCLPSAFSSQHDSIGSKCNRLSLNSDESIMLSKTTSSNRQATFESDSGGSDPCDDDDMSDDEEEYSNMEEDLGEEPLYGEDDEYEEEGEETEDTGLSRYVSRMDSSSSKSRSISTGRKSKSSATK